MLKEAPMAENASFLATIAMLFLISVYGAGSFAVAQFVA
jgi:hypothetical protein